jgi:hypothetical protein
VRGVLRGLLLLGVLAGGVIAVRDYLKRGLTGEEVVQIVFDDGSTHVLASDTVEAQEFTDIARKVVEIRI